jgi:predicted nucleic acid-binding protein
MIVSNATPLIAFARIGELALLERIVEEVTLPQAVWQEVTEASERPGAETIREATWINVQAVSGVSPDLLALLDRGEAEVIALAEELDADEVILDERAARAIAMTRGLPVIGSAGLLVRAKDRNLIPAVRPLFTRMQEAGVRYSQRFFESLLEQLGE